MRVFTVPHTGEQEGFEKNVGHRAAESNKSATGTTNCIAKNTGLEPMILLLKHV